MSDFWSTNDDSITSEYELLSDEIDKAEVQAQQIQQNPFPEPTEEILEEISDNSAFELDHHESNVVHQARLRLEMAKLYEMLINHDIFDGVDVNPQAIAKVQNELKTYIVERLEILLGIRNEIITPKQVTVNSQFNPVEIEFLKQLCYKGTLGKSASIENTSNLNTVKPIQPNKLKPIAPTTTLKKPKQPATTQNKTVTKKPIQKIELKSGIESREMTDSEVLRIAKQDLKELTSKKPFNKMTSEEKAREIARVNNKYAKPKPKNTTPIPDADQMQQVYTNIQANRSIRGGQKSQLNDLVAKYIINKTD